MEEGWGLGAEELVKGTPLANFLQALVEIKDGDIVDDLAPIKAGEVDLGEMTPFEKRVNFLTDQQREKAKAYYAELKETACPTCKSCGSSRTGSDNAPCVPLYRSIKEADERFEEIWKSIKARFPQVTNIGIRRGFRVVTNVHNEPSQVLGGNVIVLGSTELPPDIASVLAAVTAAMNGKRP